MLPGLDDGPATIEESVRVAAAAAAEGVTVLAATPHVSARYPTSPREMEDELRRLRAALAQRGIALELVPGGEVALDRLPALDAGDLRRLALAGNPGYLLVEFPYEGWPGDLPVTLSRLAEAGIRPVLAHPERNSEVQARPGRLEPLVGEGALVQITAASVDGRLGRPAQETARTLLDFGLAHMLASDAHGFAVRTFGLAAARRKLRDEALGRWLTDEVPAAIVSGSKLPARPVRGRRRRLLFR